MNSENQIIKSGFFWKWILTIFLAFPAGLILAFPVSYIINIFYPKETNLVVGLCLGAVVGYLQWLVLKKSFKISSFWGLACSIGIGIPFILAVVFDETGISLPEITNYEPLSWLFAGIIGGLITGLLQWPLFKPFFAKAGLWIAVSSIAWGLGLFAIQITGTFWLAGLCAGALILGVTTGAALLLMNKYKKKTIINFKESRQIQEQ
jgi:hypothetical protein